MGDLFTLQQHEDGQVYLHDQEGHKALHALIKNENEVEIQIGIDDIVKIDKLYGPLVAMPIQVSMDFQTGEWVIKRYDGGVGCGLREVARIPGQLDSDFSTDIPE